MNLNIRGHKTQEAFAYEVLHLANINKALHEKNYPNPQAKLPRHYHKSLDVFSMKNTHKLPFYYRSKINYQIKLIAENRKKS
ncbi:uncharacterized protein CIMG_12718 [Coccidioides immitis RS]|uniref:Uncharacterized protein n=1 Tax=Coccidioides immitis (strain RS) TaxID=246410 RepID=A0A0D8JRZ4_COCIM|nr:uncharacterized protein CIMG_12718 [Coccidioides immitis RS]KJF60067.1 hypothetical protein CIMG_12718 [Coccidioides immitis RS]